MRGPENCSEPTKSPRWPILAEYEIVNNIFLGKVLSEMEKKGKAKFYSRLRMEVESTIENARNTSNTGSKSYVWLLVRRIHGIASEIQMLSVEAVWVMPSVTGCHTLRAPICKAKHNVSDRGTSRYTFGASCNGKKPREKRWNLRTICSKVFMTSLNLSTPWLKSRRLGFEKKNWSCGTDQNSSTISTILDSNKPGTYPNRVRMGFDINFAN